MSSNIVVLVFLGGIVCLFEVGTISLSPISQQDELEWARPLRSKDRTFVKIGTSMSESSVYKDVKFSAEKDFLFSRDIKREVANFLGLAIRLLDTCRIYLKLPQEDLAPSEVTLWLLILFDSWSCFKIQYLAQRQWYNPLLLKYTNVSTRALVFYSNMSIWT